MMPHPLLSSSKDSSNRTSPVTPGALESAAGGGSDVAATALAPALYAVAVTSPAMMVNRALIGYPLVRRTPGWGRSQ